MKHEDLTCPRQVRSDPATRLDFFYLPLFQSSAERKFAREIKEKYCFVALDIEEELAASAHLNREVNVSLPDGRTIDIRNERYLCPEAFINPNLIGENY